MDTLHKGDNYDDDDDDDNDDDNNNNNRYCKRTAGFYVNLAIHFC
jgi:hypothetical protein